ncbi:MAG: hypothetical protein NVS4B8_25910 [Herpetosiphon sp.]
MAFPPYVHAVIPDGDPQHWPIQPQGLNECGVTAPANAMNLLLGKKEFDKQTFIIEAGALFRRNLGGSPSFVTGQLIKRHGFGTHFGTLKDTKADPVLRDLIDRGVPVCVELGANRVGKLTIFGQHTVVLVGYSDPYTDAQGGRHEEYYFVDAQYPPSLSEFGLQTNNVDRDGDGQPEQYPGNRSIERAEFLADFPTGIYFPVFRSQPEHDAWFAAHIKVIDHLPLLGTITDRLFSGTHDDWLG